MTTGQQGLLPNREAACASAKRRSPQSCAAVCKGPAWPWRASAGSMDIRSSSSWVPLGSCAEAAVRASWFLGWSSRPPRRCPIHLPSTDLGRLRKKDDLGRSMGFLSPRGTQSCTCQARCDGNRGSHCDSSVGCRNPSYPPPCSRGRKGPRVYVTAWRFSVGKGSSLNVLPCGFQI